MKLTKIIAFLIALGIYGFFALISTANEKPIDKFDFDYLENGKYSVDVSGESFKISEFKEDSTYKYSKISFFDDIYHTKDASIEISGDEIILTKGLFYISINDIGKKYKLNGMSFHIENKSPGHILIDNRNDKKVKIYSFDMLARLSLIDTISGTEATSFYLYPHTFLGYKGVSNSSAHQADLYRILQLYNLKYVQDAFSNGGKLNDKFTDSLLYTIKRRPLDPEGLGFLKFILKVRNNYSEIKKDFQQLKNTNIGSSLAVKFIQDYLRFFRNDDKKVIYLKNRALAQIDGILKIYTGQFISEEFKNNNDISGEIGEINNKLSSELIKTLEELKISSQEDFEEMMKILSYYNYVVVNYNDHSLTNLKQTYNIIISKFNNTQSEINENYLKINTIYSSFDNGEISISELYSMMNNYVLSRFPRVNGIINFEAENISEISSLSYSMNNIINSAVSSGDISDMHILEDKNFINFLSLYFELNSEVMSKSYSTEKLKETYLANYKNLLEKFDKVVRNYYFEEELSSSNLLLTKKGINKNTYKSVKEILSDKLLDTVLKKKGLLKENARGIETIAKKYDEYFLALDDYATYKNTFVADLPDVVGVDEGSKFEMSYEKLAAYMSQFDKFSISKSDVEIDHRKKVYIVTSARTYGSRIGFHLEPFRDNRISKIVIDDVPKPGFYELDVIKSDLEEKSERSNGDYSEESDFSKFFYNKFFAERVSDKDAEIYKAEESEIKLSASEFQFVSEKLLSQNRGEFRNINGKNITIGIPNITLKSSNSGYDIFIKGAEIKVRSEGGISFGNLDSKYKFTNTDHYFYDLQMFLKFRSDDGVKEKYFGKPLVVDGKINISDFDNKIVELGKLLTIIDYIFLKKEDEILDNLEIVYYPEKSQITLSYVSKSNKKVIFRAAAPTNVIYYKDGLDVKISSPTDFNELRF